MPFLKLNYGPYEAHGIIRHKTQRLHGLIECLTNMGYEIELVPSRHINRLTVEIMQREVFRCNIKNLLFNMDCDDDIVCQRIVNSVEEAKERMFDEGNVALFSSVKNGKREIEKLKHITDTKELLASNINLLYEISKVGSYYDQFLEYLLKIEQEQRERERKHCRLGG